MAKISSSTNRDGSTTDRYSNGGSVTIYDSSKGQNASGTGSGIPSGSYYGGSYSGGGSTNSYTNSYGDTYTTPSYLNGNKDLQYAMQQSAQNNGKGSVSVSEYAASLLNSIGSKGKDAVVAEMNRLGLQDFLPPSLGGNGILTAGGQILPGNQYGNYKEDDYGKWYSYGGQDYLVGGSNADYADYVNGKTNNLADLYSLYKDMSENSYAQADQAWLSNFLNKHGGMSSDDAQKASFIASYNNYSGNNGGGSSNSSNGYLDYLQNAQNLSKQAIEEQIRSILEGLQGKKLTAEQTAEEQAKQARLNMLLSEQSMKNALSASGLSNTGYSESSQIGLNNSYQQALNQINTDKSTALTAIDRAIAEAQSAGNAELAQTLAQYSQTIAAAMQVQEQADYQKWYNQQMLERQDREYNAAQALADRNWQYQLGQDEYNKSQNDYSNKWTEATTKFELGILDQSVADMLAGGDMAALQSAWQALQKQKKSSSRSRAAVASSSGNGFTAPASDNVESYRHMTNLANSLGYPAAVNNNALIYGLTNGMITNPTGIDNAFSDYNYTPNVSQTYLQNLINATARK